MNLARMLYVSYGLILLVSCTPITKPADSTEQIPLIENQKAVEPTPLDVAQLENNINPCSAVNAHEAWLALGQKKPLLDSLFSMEVYFASSGTKMLAISQQKREVYGEGALKSYVEVSAELTERGSRVTSFSQVIATTQKFSEPDSLFLSLPPYWQEQIQDPQAVLVAKHYLNKDKSGFVKFENDIATELSAKLHQGVELRCRSAEPCRCL